MRDKTWKWKTKYVPLCTVPKAVQTRRLLPFPTPENLPSKIEIILFHPAQLCFFFSLTPPQSCRLKALLSLGWIHSQGSESPCNTGRQWWCRQDSGTARCFCQTSSYLFIPRGAERVCRAWWVPQGLSQGFICPWAVLWEQKFPGSNWKQSLASIISSWS